MTKEKIKRREWVKNAIIIFLAVMLLLTFFSNTIMNRSLPVVSSQYPNSGTITAKIRGTGTVSSNEVYNVTVDQTREVQSVAVRVGDTVVAGQVLFTLADKESDELKTAVDALEAAQYDHDTFLLDVSATDSNVQSAQQALAKAKNARDKAYSDYTLAHGSGASATALSEAQTAFNTAKSQAESAKLAFDQAELNLTKATAELERVQGELTDEQEALKKPVDEATKQLENAQLLLDTATNDKTYIEQTLGMTYDEAKAAYDTAYDSLETLEDSIYASKETLRTALEEARTGEQTLSDTEYDYLADHLSDLQDACWDVINLQPPIDVRKIDLAHNALGTVDDDISDITYTSLPDDLAVCISDMSTLMDNIRVTLTDIDSRNSEYDKVFISLGEAQSVMSDSSLKRATEEYNNAELAVKEAQEHLNLVTIEYNNSLPTDTPELAAAKQALTQATNNKTQAEYNNTAAQNALTTAQEKLDTLKNAATAESDLSTYDDAVTDAQMALSAAIESAGISDAKDDLELQKKKKAIEDAQAEVDRLTADASPVQIVSKYNGTVTSVNVVAGDKTDPAFELATIEVTEKGYTMTLTVTAEQARKVSVGDKAELTNYWSYGNMDITLVSVTSDRDSQGQNKILTFAVEGEEVIPGQSLSISIGQKSETYDAIIPNSAVREDSAGKFVYVVQSKSSPLGNRYIAKRLDVSVLASDDTSSAVSGLSNSEFVIVSSTAPIEGGQQVRLSEE